MKNITLISIAATLLITQAFAQKKTKSIEMNTSKEHYTFQLSDKVTRQKVTFKNRYGITLSGDLYLPKNAGNEKLAALAISGPFGAVKQQSSGLYANIMPPRGVLITTSSRPSPGSPCSTAVPSL